MRNRPDPNMLVGIALFRGLTHEHLVRLSDCLHSVTFAPGTNIMTAEQPGEVIYIILDGAVKVHVEQMDGSSVILDILGSGDIVGELSLLDSVGRSANVVTLAECAFLWTDRDTFEDCLERMPALNANVVNILCGRLRRANEQIQAMATLNVHGRVARQILALATRYGQLTDGGDVHVPIRLTQGDMGSLVGASRERVNSVIASFRKHRQISVDRNHRITIHDQEALARACQWSVSFQLVPRASQLAAVTNVTAWR